MVCHGDGPCNFGVIQLEARWKFFHFYKFQVKILAKKTESYKKSASNATAENLLRTHFLFISRTHFYSASTADIVPGNAHNTAGMWKHGNKIKSWYS